MSTLQASAQKQLRQYIEQIERLEEEKKQLASDIRDKFAEAKAVGFDVKVMRQIIRLRKKSQTEREEENLRRANFMAGIKSVSPVTRIILSTRPSKAYVAMSSPMRRSTPFCSKVALKSWSEIAPP